ncbi:MAG TPA: tRNA pseudouridine(55) synthase TruB [Ktedonobacterales bacterium]
MDCIAVIDKPTGMTSHDVVARVRRLAGQRRVGHAGTLDPAATGVLLVLLGQATRVAEYLSDSGKEYRAVVRFGIETTTYDAEGKVVHEAPVTLTREQIESVMPAFLGVIQQRPPVYSAIKRGGVPLYALARAGKAVEAPLRMVRIDALNIISWEAPDLTIDVNCGKGAYIRSLAHDLGAILGPGAHLASLVRTRSGPFTLAQAISLEQFADSLSTGAWRDMLFAADEALLDWRAAILGAETARMFRDGRELRFGKAYGVPVEADELARVYSTSGAFLGIMRWSDTGQCWLPSKSLATTLETDDE